jgi:hypothetical protein
MHFAGRIEAGRDVWNVNGVPVAPMKLFERAAAYFIGPLGHFGKQSFELRARFFATVIHARGERRGRRVRLHDGLDGDNRAWRRRRQQACRHDAGHTVTTHAPGPRCGLCGDEKYQSGNFD